ncbi:methyltransferase, FxLD system [Actinokineospora terrae]|uniref:Protein-L-isoaspartate O-methyltransferase n=1 Tax=Actinokineospora terrae TaxID=155974 RepID=A0A1H9XHE0_9PSEU|nr:methyltransferase, FxLD system [Actinokineospora terrae]SES45451.1 protein-L-isoaspartate(D-aspartate) O-methyltransferase [Actinokineospora terrae]
MNDKGTPSEGTSESMDSKRAIHLRTKMVDDLLAEGTIVSPRIEAAMRKVPRESFAPGVDLEEVYQLFNGVVTKRDETGTSVSSVSAPQVQAHMLEQAAITEGMRILEIGSGGYNAALLAELVGPSGQVTTVDIDADITDRTSRVLDEIGYSWINVVLADAESGVAEYAPYDRILVTVGAWDIPPAWVEQLVPSGLLIVPLQVRGLSRTIAFEKADGYLVSRSARLFGFVSIQGAGAHQSKLLIMRGGEVTLRFDDDFPIDPADLNGVFDTPRVEVWSGATIGRFELWAGTQMWMATALPGFGRVVLDKKLSTGLITPPGSHSAAMAVVDGGNLAYITTRSTPDESQVEFGVHAFGPEATALAEAVAAQLQIWARDHRNGPGPQFHVHPANTADDLLPEGRVVNKKHSRITISWPHAVTTAAGRDALQETTK